MLEIDGIRERVMKALKGMLKGPTYTDPFGIERLISRIKAYEKEIRDRMEVVLKEISELQREEKFFEESAPK
jgi:hypothetical protein